MHRLSWLSRVAAACLLLNLGVTLPLFAQGADPDVVPQVQLATLEPAAELTIGSKAPALDIANWVNRPEGQSAQLTEGFEPGHVYVVEFWATWCGPCVQSMPHIAKLQKEYVDKKVRVISISDEDQPTIDEFLDKEVPRQLRDEVQPEGLTFRELTSGYRLTSDPDQSTQRDYMEAAGESGIPTSFVVGKSGLIEWIGHPMELDDIVPQVITDRWDRDAYKQQIEHQKKFERLVRQVFGAVRSQQFDDALKLLDDAIAAESDPGRLAQTKQLKLRVLLALRDTNATALAREVVEASSDPSMLNGFSWTVYEMHQQEAVPPELMDLAVSSADKALGLASSKDEQSGVRDTLAHLAAAQGKLKEAIAFQAKAVEDASGAMAEQLAPYLKELREQLEAGKTATDPVK